jgi:hypothetical protein
MNAGRIDLEQSLDVTFRFPETAMTASASSNAVFSNR